MAEQSHKELLFERHVEDLRRVCSNADEVFVCPICFHVFSANELEEHLTVGHVWPTFLRESVDNEAARHHQVLLCDSCNSRAGMRGDAEMQKHDQARRGLRHGKLTFLPLDRSEPFFEVGDITDFDEAEKQFKLLFPGMPLGKWEHNENMQRLRTMADKGIEFSIIYDQYNTNSNLAKAGWLTSSYLFAFYTFGYRYVFHTRLDIVREYILASFDGNVDMRLDFSEDKDLAVRISSVYFDDMPLIFSVMPVENTPTPHHLQIRFLDYHVRLPIDLAEPIVIPQRLLPEPDSFVMALATKFNVVTNPCPYDDFFTAVEYSITGRELCRLSDAPSEPTKS